MRIISYLISELCSLWKKIDDNNNYEIWWMCWKILEVLGRYSVKKKVVMFYLLIFWLGDIMVYRIFIFIRLDFLEVSGR